MVFYFFFFIIFFSKNIKNWHDLLVNFLIDFREYAINLQWHPAYRKQAYYNDQHLHNLQTKVRTIKNWAGLSISYKMVLRPAKTQIRLRVCAAWSVFARHSLGSQGYSVFRQTARTLKTCADMLAYYIFRWVYMQFLGNAVPRLNINKPQLYLMTCATRKDSAQPWHIQVCPWSLPVDSFISIQWSSWQTTDAQICGCLGGSGTSLY